MQSTPTLFPRSRLQSATPSVTEDCYKKTPQWSTFDYEAEKVKTMERWQLTVDDEIDHLPSTPPYLLLTSSDDNMSGN